MSIRDVIDHLKTIEQGTIAKNALALLLGNGTAQFLAGVAVILTTRHLGVDTSGQYLAAYVLLGQAAPFLNFGLDTLFLREAGRDPSTIGHRLASTSLAKLLLAVGWLPVLACLPSLINPQVYPRFIMWIASTGIVFQAIGNSAIAAFQGNIKNWTVCWLQVINGVFLLLPTVWLVLDSSSLTQFVWVRTGAYAVSATLRFVLATRIYRAKPGRLSLLSLYRDGAAFMAADVLAVIYNTADVTITALLLGKTDAGYYAPVVTLINILFLVPSSVYLVAIPLLSQRYAKDSATAHQIAYLILGGVTVLGCLLAAGTLVLSPFLSQLVYGTHISKITNAARLMSGVIFFKSISAGLVPILIAVNRQKKRVLVQIVAVIVNVGLNLLLIKPFGVVAAAVVYVISEFVLCLGLAIYAWPYLSVKRSRKKDL